MVVYMRDEKINLVKRGRLVKCKTEEERKYWKNKRLNLRKVIIGIVMFVLRICF